MEYPPVFIVTGKVGSGKGTQADLLAELTGHKIYSTGGKFRELRLQDTPLGRRVAHDYDAGRWVEPWFVAYVITDALFSLKDGEGIIFEGSVRTMPEVEQFLKVVDWLELDYRVINLGIDDDTAIKRVCDRARGDSIDDEEKTRKRLVEFEERTGPVLAVFREQGKVIDVHGEQTPEEVHAEILQALESYKKPE